MTSKTATSTERWHHILHLFASRVFDVRRQLNMTQSDVAEAAGVTRFAVSDIENQVRSARLPEAVLICEALGVELADMIADDVVPVVVTEQRLEFRPHAPGPR